ncbi:MAG TPA: hypothetical protein VFX65_14150 [Candidatus Limnocylindrales bacterium]|nr:hypothetical protein [Candidatus Limnocylindrales bacterium]
MVDSPADLVITGCTVLIHDAEERITFLEGATVVVRDGVIESVGTGPGDVQAAEHIDASTATRPSRRRRSVPATWSTP